MDNTNLNKPNQNMEIGWDDTIQEDGQDLVLLEEGDYNFRVTNFERGRFPGGQKIPACNKATITVQIEKCRMAHFLVLPLHWSEEAWREAYHELEHCHRQRWPRTCNQKKIHEQLRRGKDRE